MIVKIKSNDKIININMPCVKDMVFAELEENLYQKYPEYREKNNLFLFNGKQVLRFKKIGDNGLFDGSEVNLIPPK